MTDRRKVLTAAGLATAGALVVGAPAAAHGPADADGPADVHDANAERQRRRSIRTANAFYRALQAKDIDAFATLWTVDAVYRVPVTPAGTPGESVGRDAIVANLRSFFALFATARFAWAVEPMLDPARVAATWSLDIDLVAGGRYRNRGIALFRLRGERIAEFEEYFDTRAFLDTFGSTGS